MHEMSLAESIREITIDVAAQNGATRVRTIHLAIGQLATVQLDALLFGLEVVLRGGPAEGARVVVDRVPGEAWCWHCSQRFVVSESLACCPDCGSRTVQVTGGTDLRVSEVELEGATRCA